MKSNLLVCIGALVAFVCGGSVACGGSAVANRPSETSPTRSVDEEAVADLVEHHRNHHHGGVTMFIAMSLDTLGLDATTPLMPSQRANVTTIQTELYAKMDSARDAENDLRTTLAAEVASGLLDHTQIDATIDRLRLAATNVHDAAGDALNHLHSALTPAQRATLVDKVRAHWKVWQIANPPDGLDGPIAFGETISLTPEQLAKVRPQFARLIKQSTPLDVQRVTQHLDAFKKAFLSDSFDAHALVETTIGADLAGWGATRLARFCEAVDSSLTAEQRQLLVAMLREHTQHQEVSNVSSR